MSWPAPQSLLTRVQGLRCRVFLDVTRFGSRKFWGFSIEGLEVWGPAALGLNPNNKEARLLVIGFLAVGLPSLLMYRQTLF